MNNNPVRYSDPSGHRVCDDDETCDGNGNKIPATKSQRAAGKTPKNPSISDVHKKTTDSNPGNDSSNLCAEHSGDPSCVAAKLDENTTLNLIEQLNNQAVQESNAAQAWSTVTNVLIGVAITAAVVGVVVATGGTGALLIGVALGGYSAGSIAGIVGGSAAIVAIAGYASQVTGSISNTHHANQTNINTAVNALQSNKTGEVAVSAGKMYTPGSAGYSLPQPALVSVFSAIIGP